METEYITASKLRVASVAVRRAIHADRGASAESPLTDDDDPTIESPSPAIPPGTPSPLGEDDAAVSAGHPTRTGRAATAPLDRGAQRRQLVALFLLSCAAALVVALAAFGRH